MTIDFTWVSHHGGAEYVSIFYQQKVSVGLERWREDLKNVLWFERGVMMLNLQLVQLNQKRHVVQRHLNSDVWVESYQQVFATALLPSRSMRKTVAGKGLSGDLGDELHVDSEIELPQVGFFYGVGHGAVAEKYLGVLSWEVVDAQELKGFDGHEADIHVCPGSDDGSLVCSLDYVINFFVMVAEVVDQDLLVLVYFRDWQSPDLDVSIEHASDCVLIVGIEENSRKRVFFLGETVDLAPEGQLGQGEEVDVESGPDVEEVFLDVVAVAPVPLEGRVRLNRQMVLSPEAEFHAR
jgi:hypothetical protein